MSMTPPDAPAPRSMAARLGRVGRFLVFLLTGGWIFPHVCTEGMDLTRIQKEQMAKGSE